MALFCFNEWGHFAKNLSAAPCGYKKGLDRPAEGVGWGSWLDVDGRGWYNLWLYGYNRWMVEVGVDCWGQVCHTQLMVIDWQWADRTMMTR